jgi:hypothetical protein
MTTVRYTAMLATVALLLGAGAARGDSGGSYAVERRVSFIAGALAAVRTTPPEALQAAADYARTLAHGACSAGVQRLRVECLMTAARRYCRDRAAEGGRCEQYMDVLAANVLADEQLIPPAQRYQIMRHSKDYRHALARELGRIQGALAVDFRLRMGPAGDDSAMAQKIDRYCVTTADETNLAWQTCVAALVWYVRQ